MAAMASFIFLGCRTSERIPVPIALDAGGSIGDAGEPDAADAGAALPFAIFATLSDGGTEDLNLNLEPAGVTELDSAKRITVSSPSLRDYRIRLIDSSDQVVPSNDTASELDGGLVYSIELVQALKAGKAYALTIDAQNGAQFTDVAGRALDDVRLILKVRGQLEQEPAAPGMKVSKKKKRR